MHTVKRWLAQFKAVRGQVWRYLDQHDSVVVWLLVFVSVGLMLFGFTIAPDPYSQPNGCAPCCQPTPTVRPI